MKLEEAITLSLYFASRWRNGMLIYDERESKLYAAAQKTIFAEASRLILSVNLESIPRTPEPDSRFRLSARGSDGVAETAFEALESDE